MASKRNRQARSQGQRDSGTLPGDGVDKDFGKHIFTCAVTVRGTKTEAEWKELLVTACKAMNMQPVDDVATWRYPLDGNGGNGLTIVQPLTESFIALDTWPDHDGAYLFLSSCRCFDGFAMLRLLTEHGLLIKQIKSDTLGLTD